MLNKVTYIALATCLLLLAATVAVPAPQEAKEKVPKDTAEYELATKAFAAETDPKTKLQVLDEWKEKYPESDYKEDRVRIYMRTHQQLGDVKSAIGVANDILKANPNDFESNYLITSGVPGLAAEASAYYADAQKSSKQLIGGGVDAQFAADKKPAQVTADQWTTAKTQTLVSAHQTLGWIAMQKKENEAAEKHFADVLGISPGLGQVSYWLGNVVLAQGKPDKNELALFSFARAAVLEGDGALAPEGRKQVDDYLAKVYEAYTGTTDDLPQLKEMAMKSALPPASLKIESKAVRAFNADKKFRDENPLVAQYDDLKQTLLGSSGDATWEQLKGKLTPAMALYVAGSDSARPQRLNLAFTPDGATEVILNLENRLRGAPAKGSKVKFEGVASALTKDPFQLTLTGGKLN